MSTKVGAKAPMYARMLRLRYVQPGGFVCFLLFEMTIATAVLLALAELVNWWAVAALPIAVAAMVKINDFVVGLTRLASGELPRRIETPHEGRATRAADRDRRADASGHRDPHRDPHWAGPVADDRPLVRGGTPDAESPGQLGSVSAAYASAAAEARSSVPGARREMAGPGASGQAAAAGRHSSMADGGPEIAPGPSSGVRDQPDERSGAGTTYRSRASEEAPPPRRRSADDEDPRRPVGVIRISLPPRDGGVRRGAGRGRSSDVPGGTGGPGGGADQQYANGGVGSSTGGQGGGRHTRAPYDDDARQRRSGVNEGRFV